MFNVRALGFLFILLNTSGCLLGVKIACTDFENEGMCLYNRDTDDGVQLKVIEDGGGPVSIDGRIQYDIEDILAPHERVQENRATICMLEHRFEDDVTVKGEIHMADIEDGDENMVCIWPM